MMVVEQQTAADTSAAATPATPAPSGASPAASQSTPQSQQTPSAAEAAKPDYVSDEYWDADKKTVKVDALAGKLKELNDAKAADEARKASLPKTAADYKVELPDDFKLPDGWQIDTSDKAWKSFADFAHERGMSQSDFAKGAQLITEMRLAEAASRVEGAKAEFSKLGDQGKSIVDAVHSWIDVNAGSPEAAKAVKASLINAEAVRFYAKMAATMTSNGIAAFNGSGRDDGRRADGKPANWDAMSAIDRRTYDLVNQQRAAGGR